MIKNGDMNYDTTIIGGGIMGLGIAFEESIRGKRVLLLEKEKLAQKASFAAAGILTHRSPKVFFSPFRQFQCESVNLYPSWLKKISSNGAKSVPIKRVGVYHIFNLEDPLGEESYTSEMEKLKREKVEDFQIVNDCPFVFNKNWKMDNVKILCFPNESYVNTQQVTSALVEVNKKNGVRLVENTKIENINIGNTNTISFRAEENAYQAKSSHVIFAAGAWTGKILEPLGYNVPLVPVKGEVLRIKFDFKENYFVQFHKDLYIVPRPNGEAIVGSTTLANTWDEEISPEGKDLLIQRLKNLLGHDQINIIEQRSSLRPRTKDRSPLMGFLNESKTISIVTGHYKCGIAMSALTATTISQLINGEQPEFDISPFTPLRKKGVSKIL